LSTKADIGVIGLGVMGRNLALNLADRAMRVAGLDNAPESVDAFAAGDDRLAGAHDARQLAASLARPRVALLMVPSGGPVESVLGDLLEVFEPGDIVIDGGNSRWTDTEKRVRRAAERGLHFVGMGVSGGSRGAREGPSLMPGGDGAAWDRIAEPMRRIAAHAGPDADEPCCAWIGPGGSGHFVKMVHNGIEYGLMQLICEAYSLLRDAGGLDAPRIADVFARWNEGDLDSYLMEISAHVLRVEDSDGHPRIARIADAAGQKGTGRWTAHEALELGVPVPTITAAVEARNLSARRATRERVSEALSKREDGAGAGRGSPTGSDPERGLEAALGLAFRLCFAQGLEIMSAASDRENWSLDLHSILGLWRGGCIIRAAMLEELRDAVAGEPEHLLLHKPIGERAARDRAALADAVWAGAEAGTPTPCLSASLAYLDQLVAVRLPHDMLQAQRDAFGGHGYARTDREGTFTADWLGDGSEHAKG